MMDQQQPPPPLTSSSNDIMSTDNPVAASVVVKPSNDDEIIEETSVAASSPIFHVLLLPGGNLQKDSDADKANNNKPNSNVIDIIDDYLYQRHVYRKQASARRLRPGGGGVGGAEKVNDETPHHHHDDSDINISLNLVALASPLEVALVSCCVRVRHTATATIIIAATKDTSTSQSSISISSPSSSTQRSRLHRPILPSNYLADDEGDEHEHEHEHEHEQPVSLDTPRTISMKIHDPYNNGGNSGNSKEVGTLRKGQEAHFLKLLQMYCPQCKKGVMYRSLVVEILQRTADWESESASLRASCAHSNNDVGGGATATTTAADMSIANNSRNNHNNSNNHNNNNASIGQVGYTFRKQFHSGWYIGNVTEIIPTNTIRGTSTTVKDRRCVYNDGDEEDLSLEELKYLAELEELDRYHHDNDNVGDNDDDEQKINTEDVGDGGDDTTKNSTEEEGGEKNESAEVATEVQVATPPSPPVVNSANNKKKHTVMKTFLAVGGMKLLARWLVEAYTVVQPPPSSTTQSNKRKSSFSQKAAAEAAVVSPSPTGALLLPLLTLLKSIPFDKEIIVASSIHKYIKRYKKALDKLSRGMDAQSLNDVVHPLAGGGSVGKAMRGVEEVMTSWNNATAAASASATKSEHDDDNDGGTSEKEEQQQLDPYKDVRDQLQSRFDELAAFHNNRTNPPEWVPKHVLGVVMASPKAAPASPTGSSSNPTHLSTSSSSRKSNDPPTKTSNNEWGTNRASAAQLARERFLEGFRRQKDAVSSTTITGPPEKMQKVAHGNDRLLSSLPSKKVCWVDQPVGRKGVPPQPLVTERVFVKEEEYVAEEEVEMFGGEDDGNFEDVPMQEQEDVMVGNYQADAVTEEQGG